MGFRRYQQVTLTGEDGSQRQIAAGLRTVVRATLRKGQADAATVEVYNPSDATVGLAKRDGCVVEVVAGYLDDTTPRGTILRGRIIKGTVRESWPRPDHILSFQVRPADTRTNATITPKAWDSVASSEALSYVVTQAGIDYGRRAPDAGVTYRSGFSVGPDPLKAIALICADADWAYAMTNGTLDVWDGDGSRDPREAPEIAPDSGMIDSAIESASGDLSVVTQLRPDLVPGIVVVVRSRVLSAQSVRMRVREVAIESDSWGDGPFRCTVTGTPEAANAG